MTEPRSHSIDLPTHWTPTQAWAVFEIIDLLRDQLWGHYGPAIQQAMREDLRACDPRASHTPPDDPPF
jgi:hypothetical protein